MIEHREAGEQLFRQLFFSPVATLTGRIRGSVGFSQSRNTPFQGLAADGAKLAIWELLKKGFRCVAFIHDEVVIELPIDTDHTAAAKQIEQILCDSMQQLTGSIPIACEYSLSDRWYKQAEAVFEGGKLKLWQPFKKTGFEDRPGIEIAFACDSHVIEHDQPAECEDEADSEDGKRRQLLAK